MKNAFTMIELVFVIVIIGILSVVAVPKLAPIMGSAKDAKAASTLASVRSAISTERQKRILQGDFTHAITDLGDDTYVFDKFDTTNNAVLEYPMKSCSHGGCWERIDGPQFKYHFSSSKYATFELNSSRLVCADDDTSNCDELSR